MLVPTSRGARNQTQVNLLQILADEHLLNLNESLDCKRRKTGSEWQFR